MKRKVIILIFLLLTCSIGYWLYNNGYRFISSVRSEKFTSDRYRQLKNDLGTERERLASDYRSAVGKAKKDVIGKARHRFISSVTDSLFPYWYDTDWDFNGTTEVPREGSIACGYFVTTVLRDAGVNINRVKLACCASEEMIKTLVSEKYIQRFSNVSIEEFVKAVKRWGDGVYVVGLDNHTGFIVCRKGEVRFVHSGGGAPPRVVDQDPEHSKLISGSKYRVLAKLSGSDVFLEKWFTGERFK